jgi:hypothetical protein
VRAGEGGGAPVTALSAGLVGALLLPGGLIALLRRRR